MEFDVLDSLDDLGYSKFGNDSDIKSCIKLGPKSPEFTQLVEWLSKELQMLSKLDACVNAIEDPSDSDSFLLEVSSLLKELHCPYKELVTGSINERLSTVKSRHLLLDFLCTELQAARMLCCKTKQNNFLEVVLEDSDIASSLSTVKNILNIETNENEDTNSLFSEIKERVNKNTSKNPDLLSKPAFEETLTEEQWNSLQSLYKDFMEDYSVRRQLLLTRLQVTVQSFKWGEGTQDKEDHILHAYLPKRLKLSKVPSVKLSDVLAARESIFVIEKTSSDALVKNTYSSIKKYVMPGVPDRGGRPREQRPAAEMPKFSRRSEGGGNFNRGSRGHRGGGGHSNSRKKHKPKDEETKGHFDAAGSY